MDELPQVILTTLWCNVSVPSGGDRDAKSQSKITGQDHKEGRITKSKLKFKCFTITQMNLPK